jgi:hypothetical protein
MFDRECGREKGAEGHAASAETEPGTETGKDRE